MSILPAKLQDLLDFMDQHATTWQASAASIGLTAGQCTLFKTASGNARTAFNNQIAAANTAKAATVTQQSLTAIARAQAAELIAIIKAYADTQANPATVYTAAQIPEPQPPSPIPAPGTPMDFSVLLLQDGSVELKWKCNNPVAAQGTIYEVRRRTGTPSNLFTFIGASGTRDFVDDTLAAGSTGVTYQITAVRSTTRGKPAQFNVNFGVGGDGLAGVIGDSADVAQAA